jgi:hypothetical protein
MLLAARYRNDISEFIPHEEQAMGNPNSTNDDNKTATAAERKLRGTGLKGSEQKSAADHLPYEERRNPDTELHLDDEKDTLYHDGLDLEDDSGETLAGTRGDSSGIKP